MTFNPNPESAEVIKYWARRLAGPPDPDEVAAAAIVLDRLAADPDCEPSDRRRLQDALCVLRANLEARA